MTTAANPLVAQRVAPTVDPFAGIWIIEDLQTIESGIRNGSWIEGTLGVVGAGLDALALISDPVGALLQYGIAWLIEHVKPLSEALDWLAGDPAQISAHAQTWRNVAASMQQSATDLAAAAQRDLAQWQGQAADAYRAWNSQQKTAIEGLARSADTMATITEAAGMLIAAVRLMVRDAIATVVSRLIVYAAELLATLGAATPLVVEQVVTLVGSWGARIARWLKALVSSLMKLKGIVSRLGRLVEELQKILRRLRERVRPHGHQPDPPKTPDAPKPPDPPKPKTPRQELLDELAEQGIKHNPDDIVHIGRDASGKIVFLERGNPKAGLQHIMERHADNFARQGVPREQVGDLVFQAVTNGKVVGGDAGRTVFEVVFNGEVRRVAVSVGSNGFIVGAHPVSRGL